MKIREMAEQARANLEEMHRPRSYVPHAFPEGARRIKDDAGWQIAFMQALLAKLLQNLSPDARAAGKVLDKVATDLLKDNNHRDADVVAVESIFEQYVTLISSPHQTQDGGHQRCVE